MEYKYIPKSEKKKDNPVTFSIKELTVGDMVEIENSMSSVGADGKISFNIGEAKLKKFQKAVIGWENFSLEYNDENKLKIPARWYNELVDEINKQSGLSDQQIKD